jgi:23S rRNA (adenine2030-N6)-methyltransferase
MNYQHAFHAGNFADVHKHVVLTRIVEHLRAKPAPFRIIDSHAGAGRYDLRGAQASRAGEWQDGIKRVFDARRDNAAADTAADALLKPYCDIVAALNPVSDLRFYPGSPLIAKALLRPRDRLIACEFEPRAAVSLKSALRGTPGAKVLAIDGWIAIAANVPPRERRGLVLIDPPYEEADDFTRLTDALSQAHRKWPTGIYMLWYPIKQRDAPDALARRLRKAGIAKILRSEITLGPPRADAGLIGSGVILVNPPFRLEDELRIVLPTVTRLLPPGAGQRLDWLAGEQQQAALRR